MKLILIIFLHELKGTIRDRRTLIAMIIIPLFVFPLLLTLLTKLNVSHELNAFSKRLKIAYISNENGQDLIKMLKKQTDIELIQNKNVNIAKQSLINNKYDFLIVISNTFDKMFSKNKTGNIDLFYKGSRETDITKIRMEKIFDNLKSNFLSTRLKKKNLKVEFAKPFEISKTDISSAKEKFGEYVGGFIPYLFILFCFTGAMYPAIELGAGEKERYTIETLLSSPASRMEIIIGKFLVVTLSGLTSAVLGMVGLFFSIKHIANIPQDLLISSLRIIEFKSAFLIISLIIPLCLFFAAVLLSISIFANSFKEAQSLINPLNFIVIIPAAIGLMPGIELNYITALVPILNISLATKEIVSGTINGGVLAMVYIFMFIFAGIGVWFCTKWFNRENILFRGI